MKRDSKWKRGVPIIIHDILTNLTSTSGP
jgi:hypothetical protein